MKRYLAVMTAVIIACSSMLGGSAMALNDEETVPETPGEVSAEAGFTEDSITEDSAQQETVDTIPEVKEPVTLENLSPEARAKIDDEFYEKLQNADEYEVFDVSIWLTDDEAENYIYPYDKSEYDWRPAISDSVLENSASFFEAHPPVGESADEGRYGWCLGHTEDMFIYYAEKTKAIKNEHDFMINTTLTVNYSSAFIDRMKLTKAQILELAEDENINRVCNAPSFLVSC